jgi:hypothetical protein
MIIKNFIIPFILTLFLNSMPAQAAPVWVTGLGRSIGHDKIGNFSGTSYEVSATVPVDWSPYWSNGYMEFDLRDIPSAPNLTFTLRLVDTGGFSQGDSTTMISYYLGDGEITLSDDTAAILGTLTSITRPWSSPPTELDVTAIVYSYLNLNYDYIGFKFIAASGGDAFGFVDRWEGYYERHSGLLYDTSAVPLPAAFWLLGTGIVALAALRRKVQK